MLRKWIRLAQSKRAQKAPGFVALPINANAPVQPAPPAKRDADTESIRVEIPYREQSIHISWPVSQSVRCLAEQRHRQASTTQLGFDGYRKDLTSHSIFSLSSY